MSNLYHIQDDDRPIYIVADSWQHALDEWRTIIRREKLLKWLEDSA